MITARDVLGFLQDNFPNSERRDEYPRLWMDTYLNPLVFNKQDVKNVQGLDRCYSYAERFISEGNEALVYKYIGYCGDYAAATKGAEETESVFDRLEHYARENNKSVLPNILLAKTDFYWRTGEYEKSVDIAKQILNDECPPWLRERLVNRIAGHMARTGVKRTEIKQFLEQYRR